MEYSDEYLVSYSFHLTENILRNETLKFKAYYKDLNYLLISQEEKMTLVDLIATIGGLFGLFLGASFLSFIEIFELLFEAFYLIFAGFIINRKKKSKIFTLHV